MDAAEAGADFVLAETESVCPECLGRIRATRVARGDDVYLRKECATHGVFETVTWRGRPAFGTWVRPKAPVHPQRPSTAVDRGCPFDCGLCPDHRQQSCCVLLEVTMRCDLACAFCFASAGGPAAGGAGGDPDRDLLAERMRRLFDVAGPVNLQLSGGEPCVRDDLPEIAALAREVGFTFIQVNSNGLRLARDPAFARRLRDAGAATVFLQFDGTRDEIHERMRGRPLLRQKLAAIDACGEAGLGVVLVPVIVPGINDDDLGGILRFAVSHQPVVRGIHFQPVSYFGRYPAAPTNADRITLPEIIAGLAAQSGGMVRMDSFQPAGAENALCSFNGTFVSMPDGQLLPLTRTRPADACCGTAEVATIEVQPRVPRARDFVAASWAAPRPQALPIADVPSFGEWDVFLERSRTHTLAISGMAFQDAWTLDLDRLRDCHIHVADWGGADIPFCAYNLTSRDGTGPYRASLAART
jgi:uncharacterized radical SAM superfamily Fe-S cluster-containing enzyme